MDNREKLVAMRDTFRETADIMDAMIKLSDRMEDGEDVEKEMEDQMGKFLVKMMKVQAFN